MSAPLVVIGAGAAGLTAAYLHARERRPVAVLEAEPVVGGLARTVERDGFRFDLGGHRFFTKSPEVELLWHEILGSEMLVRPRLSRIYYRGRFLNYPLDARNVVRRLGPVELVRAAASYLVALSRPNLPEETFEQWVSKRFGRRLFKLFFASYTEKVWGVPCDELRGEWAAQRIRGLSFGSAARSALFGGRDGEIRSLIERFHYPRLGPGQMWEEMRRRIEADGGVVHVDTRVDTLRLEGGRVTEVRAGGLSLEPEDVVSSLPLSAVAAMADPAPPPEVLEASRGLRHRGFLTVALVLRGGDPFPDNWLYIHDPDVRVARIQNYRAWSPSMVPDATRACVGLEYFCFPGDATWSISDDGLVELAARELEQIGLAHRSQVEKGYVVRVPDAYPIYDAAYQKHVERVRGWVDGIENLQQIGRNGLHRYNNMDHSMLTAIQAVENLDGAAGDVWSVNADPWYHEAEVASELPYRRAADHGRRGSPA